MKAADIIRKRGVKAKGKSVRPAKKGGALIDWIGQRRHAPTGAKKGTASREHEE